MKERKVKAHLKKTSKAVSLPVTFLMLFVSLMLLITTTYYVAMTRLTSKGLLVNFSVAKQSMITLENTIQSVMWSPGAASIYKMEDLGGNFAIRPTAKVLTINVAGENFDETLFQSPVGEMVYKLAYAEPGSSGLFLKGSSAQVVNNSFSTMARLQIATGSTSQEIRLSYRPFVSSTVIGSLEGKPVNALRIYIVNMNSSQAVAISSGFRLKVRCLETVTTTKRYNLSYQLSSITVKASFDGDAYSKVVMPITSNVNGTIVDVETVICNIQMQEVGT
ncbi:MAG: hypothetical protein QXJ02_06145 [Candidatus Bathyarchaeia archaeon]